MLHESIYLQSLPNQLSTLSVSRNLHQHGGTQQLLHEPVNRAQQNIESDDWDLRGTDTQYSTNGMHTWLAAMIPGVARKIIEKTRPQRILDPFCGGGTVLVESGLNGIPSSGVDINPLAVILSKAKTTPIGSDALHEELLHVLKRARHDNRKPMEFPSRSMIDFWYKPYMMKPLSALSRAVRKIHDDNVRTFFLCVFSATARDVSLCYRNEIRLRRMEPKQREKFNPDVMHRFHSRAVDSIQRLKTIPSNIIAEVKQADIRRLPYSDEEFTTIICSPPYGDERNGVPYFQFSKNMLYWLGWKTEDVSSTKAMTLGWVGERTDIPCPPSPTLRELLIKIDGNKRTQLEAVAFYHDYYNALKEMVRVTSEKIAIVIGKRVLLNTIFDNAQITTELLQSHGVALQHHFVRNLPSKRLPKMREFGAAINQEDIVIYGVSRKNV